MQDPDLDRREFWQCLRIEAECASQEAQGMSWERDYFLPSIGQAYDGRGRRLPACATRRCGARLRDLLLPVSLAAQSDCRDQGDSHCHGLSRLMPSSRGGEKDGNRHPDKLSKLAATRPLPILQ